MLTLFLRFPRLPQTNHAPCRSFGRFDDEQDDDPQSWPDWRYWANVDDDDDFEPEPTADDDEGKYLDWDDDDTEVYQEPPEDLWTEADWE